MGKTQFPPMSDADLSRFWYCPKDNSRLQPKLERIAQNPFFRIEKDNMGNSIYNAVSLHKIPESATQYTELLAKYMFGNLPAEVMEIDLVGTECPTCQGRYSSPKMVRILELGKGTGKALFDTHRRIATKNYGRFRLVDRFGFGGNQDQDSNSRNRGLGGLFLLGFFFGFFNIILVLLLYYIMGFEIRIGSKFYPIGALLLITVLGLILYFLLSSNILVPFIRHL